MKAQRRRWRQLGEFKRLGTHKAELCQCECGTVAWVRLPLLFKKSFGCGKCKNIRHGMFKSRLYVIWAQMKQRCENPKAPSFYLYGAKGIRICDEWASEFSAFASWALANGYAENLTLDRINGGANYDPGNCRWATAAEQSRNKSTNVYFELNGVRKIITDWCNEYGQTLGCVRYRMNQGMSFEEALKKPSIRPKKASAQ